MISKISSGICSSSVKEARGFRIEPEHAAETFSRVLLHRRQDKLEQHEMAHIY
ncbi:hypothetical protein ACP3P8_24225 [Pseudomonas aeruginosa]